MIDPAILATLPAHLQTDWAAGNLYRVGMLLFRKGEPGIVAHLVETGAMQKVIPSILSATPAGAIVEAANLGATVFQNEQIKAGIEVLKSLQLTNLAVSGTGIGVSILSYALLEKRLRRIEAKVDAMDDKLDRIAHSIAELRNDALRTDFMDLKTACEEADDAWLSSNAQVMWDRAAAHLHRLQNRFHDRARLLLESGRILEIEPFVDAYALAASTRISCRIAMGEQELATTNAHEHGGALVSLLEQINADSLTHARLKGREVSQGSSEYASALAEELEPAKVRASIYRDQEQVALSLPHTLIQLDELEISGREWLEGARSEQTFPLLYLWGNSARIAHEKKD